jgi:hypothetical protein
MPARYSTRVSYQLRIPGQPEHDSGLKPNSIPGQPEHEFRAEAEHFLANPGTLFGLPPECFPQVAALDIHAG